MTYLHRPEIRQLTHIGEEKREERPTCFYGGLMGYDQSSGFCAVSLRGGGNIGRVL